MSSSRNRKKISNRNKKQVIISEKTVEIPEFPELKKEMDKIKEQIKEQKKINYDPTDKYMCETCNIYLLYKNINKHCSTKTHLDFMKQ